MAESILFHAATSLVTKLGSLALRELQLLWGVDAELEKLKDTIAAMEVVLLDAEEQQFKSHAVKNWISRLKDAFYDIEDLIDEFSYETLKRQVMLKDKTMAKEVRKVFSKPNQIAFRFKMGHKIKEIREKLEVIDADKNQFHFSERMINNSRDVELRKRRESSSFIYDDEVIGRKDDKKAIIDLLLDTDVKQNIAVIAIVGMGGLGKTALAQLIYNDEKTTKNFDLKLWVCISEEFDVKVVSEKIIEFATKKKPEKNLQMDLLQSELREHIDGHKYLLVMDDVWNEEHEKWVNLKRLLMGGAKGSRILITTRHQQVAETFDTTSSYSLGKLDEKSAWLLFKKMALGSGELGKELENSNLVEIGKEIVVKLKGIPLAIRTIGRLLYTKKSELHLWLSFKDNELYQVIEQREEAQFMRSILELSYNHLKSNLKQCFLYCALFPKDYHIQKDEVIRQWVAQGFVQSNGTIEPNDIGEDYFMELFSRSFFQDVVRNKRGDIIECKMHDFIHDLARSIGENEYAYVNRSDIVIHKRIRHIYVGLSFGTKLESLESLFEAKNLRTLIIEASSEDCQKVLDKIPSKFLRLRTLSLRFIEKLPKSICKLKHLRYLSFRGHEIEFLPNSIIELYNLETLILSYCINLRELPRDAKNWINLRYLNLTRNWSMKFLPNSITELYNLETLILNCCDSLQDLPKDITNLINLKHLDLSGCKALTHIPKGLGELSNLQRMTLFSIKKDTTDSEFIELNRLNKLTGSLTIQLGKNSINLKLKSGLQKLKLDWSYFEDWPMDIVLDNDYDRVLECLQPHSNIVCDRVLECLQPHSNVQKIHICKYQDQGVGLCNWLSSNTLAHLVSIELSCCFKLQHLPQLDQFLSLKHLCLFRLPCIEYIDQNDYLSSSTYLPSLKTLSIVDMHNLKGWWKGETSSESSQFPTTMPCLSQLRIHHCPLLASIPWHAPLQSLEISAVSLQLFNTVMKMTTSHCVGVSSSTRSKLSSFYLANIGHLDFLPNELFYHSTNLEHLKIVHCKSLQMSYSLVQHPINEDNDDVLWKEFRSLRSLLLQEIPKLEYLPNGLQHVTTLKEIFLAHCPNLITLPEWISGLTSLSSLVIMNCPKLTSLPQGIRHLHSLQSLTIWGCSKLKERCKEGTGEDWPKISHVRDIKIE